MTDTVQGDGPASTISLQPGNTDKKLHRVPLMQNIRRELSRSFSLHHPAGTTSRDRRDHLVTILFIGMVVLCCLLHGSG